MMKTVVGVDPPVSLGMCGIIVARVDNGPPIRVLADESVEGLTPLQWAHRVAQVAHSFDAEIAVAALMGQGDLVRAVIKQATDRPVLIRPTQHTFPTRFHMLQGLYETGRLVHACPLPDLAMEIEQTKRQLYGHSRDRLDALLVAVDAVTAPPAAQRVFV